MKRREILRTLGAASAFGLFWSALFTRPGSTTFDRLTSEDMANAPSGCMLFLHMLFNFAHLGPSFCLDELRLGWGRRSGPEPARQRRQVTSGRVALALIFPKKAVLSALGVASLALPILISAVAVPAMYAQDDADWQTAAGGNMFFDVASVKRTTGPFTPPSFPLESSDAFTPTGGRFIADFPLAAFIAFAYKIDLTPDQRQAMLAHLPEWVSMDRFIIDAKGPSNATKDQFRLMMQSLLADRFHLKAHFESRDVLVYALALTKTGKLGPALQPHSTGPACPDTADLDSPQVVAAKKAGVFPPICGNYGFERTSGGHVRWGSRNTTMAALASALPHVPFLGSLAAIDRPVVDRTGLRGTFDFKVEYVISPRDGDPGDQPADPDQGFLDAVREQIGLQLKSDRASIRTLVIDRIERPSAN